MCQRNDVEQLRKQQKTGRLFETLTFLEKQMNDEAVIQDADKKLFPHDSNSDTTSND